MLKFDEQKQLASYQEGLALRGQIEEYADKIWADGFDGIFFLGIGGTYASSMQVVTHMTGRSNIPVYVENAAEYLTTGNKRITDRSVVVYSSVTGSTEEMIKAVDAVKEKGVRIFAFIDFEGTELAKKADYLIVSPKNEQLKFFMLANRLMYNNGEFPEYEKYNAEMDAYLAQGLVDAEKQADAFAQRFAQEHMNDQLHYFVGAGNQWGATYSYAMCYWEEQHWIRTRAVQAGEFFHGMLEVVDRDTNVTVFLGEDAQRPLAERVAKFLPRICGRYTLIDSKDYALKGISPEFRGSVSHLVMHAVTNRIDAHMEKLNCHPTEIRRYYRQLDY